MASHFASLLLRACGKTFLQLSSTRLFHAMKIVRPWRNDSIFHSIFSSTFDLKVERLLSVVEHMWPNGSIFRSTFLSTFQLLIFPQRMSAKIFTITNICLLNETLLRMLSLDLLDKVAKRLDFHSTTILLLNFFDKDQTSLKITPLHSTHSAQGGQTARFFPQFLVE